MLWTPIETPIYLFDVGKIELNLRRMKEERLVEKKRSADEQYMYKALSTFGSIVFRVSLFEICA